METRDSNQQAAVAGRHDLPSESRKVISFPTVHMEDTEAELWLAAHDRLVKAAHAADKYLACSAIFSWKIDFDCRTLKEFRAAVMEIKALEAEHRGDR